MRRIARTQTRSLRRGAATVEMAVVAPVLLLMMLGTMEVGYTLMVKQTMALATNEAARIATLPGYTADDVREYIDATLAKAGLQGYAVETNLDELGPTDRNVWVEVKIPLNRVLFTGGMLGGGSFELTSKKTAHREMDPNLADS